MPDRRAPWFGAPSRVGSQPAWPGNRWPARHHGRVWEPAEGCRIGSRVVDRLRLAVLLAALLAWAAPAQAATVVIVRPLHTSPELNENLSRLHGELLSLGLEVEIAGRPAAHGPYPADWRAWLEALAAARGASAVIDLIGDSAPFAVDIWVMEKSPHRLEVSRVAVDPNTESASERLAIRAAEVLRSSFLEIDLEARERRGGPVARPMETTVPQVESVEPLGHVERLGVEAGAAVFTSLDGVGPALSPLLRLDWAARPWLVVQAAWAGLGSRPTVATTAGNAWIAQQYGVLGAGYRFRSERGLRPFLALSAGVLRTSVEGQAISPKQGHAAATWSFLAEGSLGVELHLVDRYHLTLAAHVQVAEPYVAIHFVDAIVATSGRPNLVMTLTLRAWL